MTTDRRRTLAGALFLALGVIVLGIALLRPTGGGDDGPDADHTADPLSTTLPTAIASRWPVETEFRPIKVGSDLEDPRPVDEVGLHLWQDYDGWYLWSTGVDREHMFVVVDVDGEIPEDSIRPVGSVTHHMAEPGQLVLLFEPGEPSVAGVRFNPGFFTSTIRVESSIEGQQLLLGTNEVPVPMPIQIDKDRPLATG